MRPGTIHRPADAPGDVTDAAMTVPAEWEMPESEMLESETRESETLESEMPDSAMTTPAADEFWETLESGTPEWTPDPMDLLRTPWAQHAEDLGRWTWDRLVNASDVWGRYLPLGSRSRGKSYTAPPVQWRGQRTIDADTLEDHFAGADVGDIIGFHAIGRDNTSRWIAFDIDAHGQDADPAMNLQTTLEVAEYLRAAGLNPLIEDSDGAGGFHVWVFLREEIDSAIAHRFARGVAARFPASKLEIFPKQARLAEGQYGNWLRIPGRHHTRPHFSKFFVDGAWLEGEEAVLHMLGIGGDDGAIVERLAAAMPECTATISAAAPAGAPATRTPLGNWLRGIAALVPLERLDQYDDWVRTGAAVKHELPTAEGLHIWDEISRKSDKFQEGDCSGRWEGFTESENPVTVGTLIMWIREENATYRAPRRPQTASRGDAGEILILSSDTLPTAQKFIGAFYQHEDAPMLRSYGGAFWAWEKNKYAIIEDEKLRHQLQPWLHSAQCVDPKGALYPFTSNAKTIESALKGIRAFTHIDATTPMPSWIGDATGKPDPRELLPFRSGILHVPSGRVLAPTPALFAGNAIDFDWNPEAGAPTRWFAFLRQLWGDDRQSMELLQEFAGYSLVADTSRQKMLLLVGPKRAGKGTICRVIAALVGAGNVAAPTMESLGRGFGLQPLIGKSLAIVGDAGFTEKNGATADRLKSISGEDAITVDIKYREPVTLRLPTRFIFCTNADPRLDDGTAVLASRFLVLTLTKSFYGREDIGLAEKLTAELPGILRWAVIGLRRLARRGHFMQPAAGATTLLEMEELAAPILLFIRERCLVGPQYRVEKARLFGAWKTWCESQNRKYINTAQVFGRDLRAVLPQIDGSGRTTGNAQVYRGIAVDDPRRVMPGLNR